MTERAIEAKCRKLALQAGWLCWKWVSPGTPGVPDRILLGPSSEVWFVEFKRPGGRLSKLQSKILTRLIERGMNVAIIDNTKDFEAILTGQAVSPFDPNKHLLPCKPH